MSLSYAVQTHPILFGTKSSTGVLTPVTLTAAYDADDTTQVVKVGGMSMIALDLSYTMGAAETANSLDIRIQSSPDDVNYYSLMNDATAGGVSTLTPRTFSVVGIDAANIKVSIPLEVMYEYIKISIKEVGVAANFGTLYGEVTVSGK